MPDALDAEIAELENDADEACRRCQGRLHGDCDSACRYWLPTAGELEDG